MPNPTILLVGEAWHTTDYLKPLATALEAAAYPTVSLALSSARGSPAFGFGEDVIMIRSTAINLKSEGKDIVAVMHGFGGVVGTDALHALGDRGPSIPGVGVVRGLVYVASMLLKQYESSRAYLTSLGGQSWKPMRDATEPITVAPGMGADLFYNDLERKESKRWEALLRPQTMDVFLFPLSHETYKEIPSLYISTTKDHFFTPEDQLKTVSRVGPTMTTKYLDTGHSPFLSKPEELKGGILSFIAELDR